jgi:hypothetical protein
MVFSMETREEKTKAESLLESETPAPFRMLTVYDSAESSRQADRASRLVLQELGEDISVDKSSWDARLLRDSGSCSKAASEAALADIILIASSAVTPSDPIKNWVAHWEKNRKVNGGLIAFIPTGDSETGGDLASYLYETAVSAEMDFLCRKSSRR